MEAPIQVEYLKNIETGRVFPATKILLDEAAHYGKLIPCDEDGNLIENPPEPCRRNPAPYYVPAQKVADDLKARYNFTNTFDLCSRLGGAFLNHEAAKLLKGQDVPVGEMTKNLRNLRDCCASLRKALERVTMNERNLMRHYPLGKSLRQLQQDTGMVREIANNALQDLDGKKSKRKGDPAVYAIMAELIEIWRDGTGQDPKVVHARTSDGSEDFTGPFFEFVIECLDLADVRYHSRGAVGKTLQRQHGSA